jgi:hypothetical protein
VVNGDRDEDEGVEGEIVVVKAGGKTDVRRSVVENAVVDMLWFVCVFLVSFLFFFSWSRSYSQAIPHPVWASSYKLAPSRVRIS